MGTVSPGFDLVVAGRPSVDLVFADLPAWPSVGRDIDSTRFGVCAGTSFNTPASAHRLGLRVAYIATIGTDVWSDLVRDEWRAVGLPEDFLQVEPRPLPGVSVALNHDGDRGFVSYWADDHTTGEGLLERALEIAVSIEARHLHAYADEMPALEVAARERGMTISLDATNGAWSATDRSLPDLLRNADVLFANEDEARALGGGSTTEEALRRLAAFCPCVVVKRGSSGAIGIAEGRIRSVAAEPVDVVDTTGAGDCFNAGFLAGWLDGMTLEGSLTLGAICGTRAVSDFGGYRACPTRSELSSLAAQRGVTFPKGSA